MRIYDVLRIMLPTTHGFHPQITSRYGNRNGEIHLGIDVAYPDAANTFISEHPPVYSPVSGVVQIPVNNNWGQIFIRDYEGNLHRFTHLDSINPNLKNGEKTGKGVRNR